MDGGVYLTPISRLIEIGLAVGGIVIVYLMVRLFVSRHAWGEGAEYEMLGLAPPEGDGFEPDSDARVAGAGVGVVAEGEYAGAEEEDRAALKGLIGLEDRIVRFGFTIALTYLAITWFGIRSLAMWLSVAPVVYMLATALVGRDPIYRWFGLTTEFDFD